MLGHELTMNMFSNNFNEYVFPQYIEMWGILNFNEFIQLIYEMIVFFKSNKYTMYIKIKVPYFLLLLKI